MSISTYSSFTWLPVINFTNERTKISLIIIHSNSYPSYIFFVIRIFARSLEFN